MNNEYFVDYEPNVWNCDAVKKSSNCYQYMLDDLNYTRIEKCNETLKEGKKDNCGQIGMLCPDEKCKKLDTLCDRYKYQVLHENKHRNIYEIDENLNCPTGYYKGALLFAPLEGKDDGYHFMREDIPGSWSHKYSYGEATNKDLNNNLINDLDDAYLDYNYKPDKYWNFNKKCGFFCIKENDNRKIKDKILNSEFCRK